jgi:hypothetical protein
MTKSKKAKEESGEMKCRGKVRGAWASRRDDIGAMLIGGAEFADVSDEGDDRDGFERFCEYGLSFDYVVPGTFDDQDEGYWHYQISYGGPSEEIRFYSSDNRTLYKAEFWFMDWFDGAKVLVTSDRVARAVWEFFVDAGSVQAERERAEREA